MAKIPTAYEKACERVIVSKKQPQIKDFEVSNVDLPDYNNIMPEFIKDFNHPLGNVPLEDIEMAEPTQRADMGYVHEVGDIPKHNDSSDVNIQESETFSFDKDVIQISWHGNFVQYNSESRINRSCVFGLSNRNILCKVFNNNNSVPMINDTTIQELNKMSQIKLDRNDAVIWRTLHLNKTYDKKDILYLTIPVVDDLHKKYVDHLNTIREIWVPTHLAKEMLVNNGVESNIFVMPYGIDFGRYNENVQPLPGISNVANDFIFLSVCEYNDRKNIHGLIQSFFNAFTIDDDVSLMLVCRNKDKVTQCIKDIIEKKNLKHEVLPHVFLYDKPVKEINMPNLYKACNCFIMLSNKENFGLSYLEASACGLPVIGTYCSAQSEYLNEENSFGVRPLDTDIVDDEQFYVFDSIDNDIENDVANIMKHVREFYSFACKKNKKLQEDIAKYDMENLYRAIATRLKEKQKEYYNGY